MAVTHEGAGVLETSDARPQHLGAHQRREAAGHVHDARARKVDDAGEEQLWRTQQQGQVSWLVGWQ